MKGKNYLKKIKKKKNVGISLKVRRTETNCVCILIINQKKVKKKYKKNLTKIVHWKYNYNGNFFYSGYCGNFLNLRLKECFNSKFKKYCVLNKWNEQN